MTNKLTASKQQDSWVTRVVESIPEHSRHVSKTLKLIHDFTYLEELDFHVCSLTSAIMSNNGPLAQEIEYTSILFEHQFHREMAKGAASTVSLLATYGKGLEFMQSCGIELENTVSIDNNYQTVLDHKFKLYLFAASVLGNHELTFKNCYAKVRDAGFSESQLHDVIKLASVIQSINKVAI